MTIPTDGTASQWTKQRLVSQASSHLRSVLHGSYPSAAAIVSTDPQGALFRVPDVDIRWMNEQPKGACDLGGVYDGDAETPKITLRRSSNEKRNNFTALHELGHHLLYGDEDWAFRVLPSLGEKAWVVEEKVVNDFAASLLVPDSVVNLHLGNDVTSDGIRQMMEETQGSATTCCIRALGLPGERLVMMGAVDGRVWYSDSNGMPYNPGKSISQPSIAAAADRAAVSGEYTLFGGEGIRYSTGWADTNVKIDVVLHETLVIAVVTSTRPDSRLRNGMDWMETCTACGEDFHLHMSSGECGTCGEWKCPDCRGCECSNTNVVICNRCFLALSVVEVTKGLEAHEDC